PARPPATGAALPWCTLVAPEDVAAAWPVPLAFPPYGAFNISKGVKSLSCATTVPGRHSKWSRGAHETETINGRAANAVVTAPATISAINIVRGRNRGRSGLGITIGADSAGVRPLPSTRYERVFKT